MMLRSFAFIAPLFLATVPVVAADYKVGDCVLAHWEQGDAFFVATIVEDKESHFFVLFEDGDTASVKKTLIRKNDIGAGSKVVARWKNGQYYRATVGKIVGRALYVHYDHGDKGWAPWSWIAVKDGKTDPSTNAEDALSDVRSRATDIQISSIHNAIKMFEIRMGSKPESLQALVDGPSNPAQKARWWGKILDELPTDSWKNKITYRITDDNYELRSSGADGQVNTEDDIVSTGRSVTPD